MDNEADKYQALLEILKLEPYHELKWGCFATSSVEFIVNEKSVFLVFTDFPLFWIKTV